MCNLLREHLQDIPSSFYQYDNYYFLFLHILPRISSFLPTKCQLKTTQENDILIKKIHDSMFSKGSKAHLYIQIRENMLNLTGFYAIELYELFYLSRKCMQSTSYSPGIKKSSFMIVNQVHILFRPRNMPICLRKLIFCQLRKFSPLN